MMSDEHDWITKAQAAAVLGVDERTIERRARAGRIGARGKPGFPTLYRAADVEMLRHAGPGEVQSGVLDPVTPGSSNGNGAIASVRHPASPAQALLVEMLQALRGALADSPTGPTGPTNAPTGPTLSEAERAAQFVTLAEASAIKGLSPSYLRRAIAAGTLRAMKDRGWKIRRRDLEAL